MREGMNPGNSGECWKCSRERTGGWRSIFLFVPFVEIEEGLDFCPMGKVSVALHLLELGSLVIAPAALCQAGSITRTRTTTRGEPGEWRYI